MKPYYEVDGIVIYHGDCRDVLPHVKADAVVTDPPYLLRLIPETREWDDARVIRPAEQLCHVDGAVVMLRRYVRRRHGVRIGGASEPMR